MVSAANRLGRALGAGSRPGTPPGTADGVGEDSKAVPSVGAGGRGRPGQGMRGLAGAEPHIHPRQPRAGDLTSRPRFPPSPNGKRKCSSEDETA